MLHSISFAPMAALLAALVIIGAPATSGTITVPQRNGTSISGYPVENPDFEELRASLAGSMAAASSRRGGGGIYHSYPTGVALVTKIYEVEYKVPIEIGTPPQTLYLMVDTGSADTWLVTTKSDPKYFGGERLYDPDKSNTSRLQDGWRWSITYGEGSTLKGSVYQDVFSIGGVEFQSQAVEALEYFEGKFFGNSYSGILGLGFSKANQIRPGPQKTFVENAYGWQWGYSAQFSIDLQRDGTGSIEFGLVDPKKYIGDIIYTPVIDNDYGYWAFNADGYKIGDQYAVYKNIPAMVDTGSEYILVPDWLASAYYGQVHGSYKERDGYYYYPCNVELPYFSIILSNQFFIVPGYYLKRSSAGSVCEGDIQPGGPGGYTVLGNRWISAVYASFHLGQKTIGFALKACCIGG